MDCLHGPAAANEPVLGLHQGLAVRVRGAVARDVLGVHVAPLALWATLQLLLLAVRVNGRFCHHRHVPSRVVSTPHVLARVVRAAPLYVDPVR